MTNDRKEARGGLIQQAVFVEPGNVYRWVSMTASDSGFLVKAFCVKTDSGGLIWEQASKLSAALARQNTIFVVPAGVSSIDIGLCFMDPTEAGYQFQVMTAELLPFEDTAARTFGQIVFGVSLFTLVVMALTAAFPSGAQGLANKGQWEPNAFSMIQQIQFVVICARLSESPIAFQFFAAPFRCSHPVPALNTHCVQHHILISDGVSGCCALICACAALPSSSSPCHGTAAATACRPVDRIALTRQQMSGQRAIYRGLSFGTQCFLLSSVPHMRSFGRSNIS